MTFDQEGISNIVRHALKRSFPEASKITIEKIQPVKTAMTWKSVVLSARCRTTIRGRIQTIELFGGWDKEHPISKKQAYNVLRFLWGHGFSRTPLLVPQPLLFDTNKSLLLYISYRGETVYRLLSKIKPTSLKNLLQLSGRWAARLHRLRASNIVPRISDADDRSQHKRNTKTFLGRGSQFFKSKNVSPETVSADTLRKKIFIRNHLPALSLVHNDLHLRNILTNKKQNEIAVIDFNETHLGDPLDDVATFLVHLDAELASRFPLSKIRRLQQAFLAGYVKERKRSFSKDEEARLAVSASWTALRFLQYTLESNPPFPHRHSVRKLLCKIEERFWRIAQNPEHFLSTML